MAKKISLPFKGNYLHSQSFGARPDVYAKFGLMGHDGDDWIMSEGTVLMAPMAGVVLRVGNDVNGWGNYVWIYSSSQSLIVNIGHMSEVGVAVDQKIQKGDPIGLSGNTGFSSAPHVHVAAADTNLQGAKINTDNGFKGWYSVLDTNKIELLSWPAIAVTPEKKKTVKERPDILNKTYQLNPHWAGLSLKQIADSGISLGRVDLLSKFLGIPEEQKLQPGQLISLTNFPTDYYPDSSEWLALKLLTQKGTIGNVGEYYIKPEYAGKTLKDIRGENNLAFRTDILGSWLGVGDATPLLADDGFGTQGFPNIQDTGSGEVQAFFNLFTKTPPASVQGIPVITAHQELDNTLGQPSMREASISVTSTPPKGKIYIDGLYLHDLTPSNKPYLVVPGQHEVRVELVGYVAHVENVDIKEGEQKQLNVTLGKGAKVVEQQIPESSLGTAIAVEALAVRIAKIEQILTEMGRL